MSKKHDNEIDYSALNIPEHLDEVDYASIEIPGEVKKKDVTEKPGFAESMNSVAQSGSETLSTLPKVKSNHEVAEENHANNTLQNTRDNWGKPVVMDNPTLEEIAMGGQPSYKIVSSVSGPKITAESLKSKERDQLHVDISKNLQRVQDDELVKHDTVYKGILEANKKKSDYLNSLPPDQQKAYLDDQRSKEEYNAKLTSESEQIQLSHYKDELKNNLSDLKSRKSNTKRYDLVTGEIYRLEHNIQHRNQVNDEDPTMITQQFEDGQMGGEDEGVREYLNKQKIENPGHYHDLIKKANSGHLTDSDKANIVTNVKQNKSADILRDVQISTQRGHNDPNSPQFEEFKNEVDSFSKNFDESKNLYKSYPDLVKKQIQSDKVQQYLKTHPVSGFVYSTVAAGYNQLAGFAESLISDGKAIADVVEAPFINESDYMKTSDKMMENIHDFIGSNVKLTTIEQKVFNEDGSINLQAILPAIVEQGVNMALLIEGGKEITGIAEAAGMSSKAAEKVGIFTSNMAMTYTNQVRDGMENHGLSAKDARIKALTTASAESFIYSLNPAFFSGEGKKGLEEVVDLLGKGDKKAMAAKLTKLLITDPAAVSGQMVAADVTDRVSGYVANKVLNLKDGDKFNDEYTKADFTNTVAMTVATTWLLGGLGHKSTRTERDGAVMMLGENLPKSIEFIAEMQKRGDINDTQANQLVETAKISARTQKSIPHNLDAESRNKIIPLLVEKNQIEEENKGLDPIFQKENDKRIEEINTEVRGELGFENPKIEENAVQKPVAEKVLQRTSEGVGEQGSGRVEPGKQGEEATSQEEVPKTKEDLVNQKVEPEKEKEIEPKSDYVERHISADIKRGEFESGSPEEKKAKEVYGDRYDSIPDVQKPLVESRVLDDHIQKDLKIGKIVPKEAKVEDVKEAVPDTSDVQTIEGEKPKEIEGVHPTSIPAGESTTPETPKGPMSESGLSKRVREDREVVSKQLKAHYEKNPILYDVVKNSTHKEAAEKMIIENGVNGVYDHVMNSDISLDELPAANVAGHMAELMLFEDGIKAQDAGDSKLAQELFDKSDRLREKVSEYNVKAGRIGSAQAVFASSDPRQHVEAMKKAIDRENDKPAKKAEKDFNAIESEVKKRKKTAAKNVSERIKQGHAAIERATTEKIAKIRDKRSGLFDKLKKSGGLVTSGGLDPQKIEAVAEIAASYIEEGYVRLEELAKKMKSDFKVNMNHDLTDDQIEQILASKYGDKSISELAHEKEKELISSFKEKEGGVVEKEAKARKFTPEQFIQEQKDIERKRIGDMIEKNYNEGESVDGLKKRLREDMGYDPETAERLAKTIDKEIADSIRKETDDYIRSKLKIKTEPTDEEIKGNEEKSKKRVEENKASNIFMDLVLSGAATKEEYKELFKDKYGLLSFTPEDARVIYDLSKNIRSSKGAIQEKLVNDLVKYMSEKFPAKKIDKFWALYYPSILSGPSTHVVNIATSLFHLIDESILSGVQDIVRYPKNVIESGWSIPESAYQFVALTKGLIDGNTLSTLIMKYGGGDTKFNVSGQASGENLGQKLFAPTDIEAINFKTKNKLLKPFGWVLENAYKRAYKYVPRFLNASDMMGYSGAYHKELIGQIRDRYLNQGLRGSELHRAVMDDIWGTKEKTAKAISDAQKEMSDMGLFKKDPETGNVIVDSKNPTYIRRVKELISDNLEEDVRDKATKFARRMTFKGKPQGTMGLLAELTSRATSGRWNPLKLVQPFVNVPYNIANVIIDRTPYGILRANGLTVFNALKNIDFIADVAHKKGIESSTYGAESGKSFPDIKSREYQNQLTKGIIATGAYLTLRSLMSWSPDDKNGKVMITGSHAGFNKTEMAQREKVYPAHSIFFRQTDGSWGKPVPYSGWNPYAMMFSMLGNESDLHHKGDISDDDTVSYIASTALASGLDLWEMMPTDGIFNLANVIQDLRDPNNKNKIGNFIKSVEKGFIGNITMPLIPNFAKQLAKINDPRMWHPQSQKEVLWRIIGGTGTDDNTDIDVLGQETRKEPGEKFVPYSAYLGMVGQSEVRTFLVDNNIYPHPPSAHTPYVDFTQDVKASDAEEAIKEIGDDPAKLRILQINGGQLAEKFIKDHLPELKEITDHDILKKNISHIFNDQRKHVIGAIEKGHPIPSSYYPTRLITEAKGEKKEARSLKSKFNRIKKESNKYQKEK